MNNTLFPNKFSHYGLIRLLQEQNLMKGKFDFSPDAIKTAEYKMYEQSLWYKLCEGVTVNLELIGRCNVYENPTILLKATDSENEKVAIVDSKLNHLTPFVDNVEIIELKRNLPLFITSSDGKYSLYDLNKCIVDNALSIDVSYTDEINYISNDMRQDTPITCDMELSKVVKYILIKKKISTSEQCVQKALIDIEGSTEFTFDLDCLNKSSLAQTIPYSAFRHKYDDINKDYIIAELVVEHQIIEDENNFVKTYKNEHELFPVFFTEESMNLSI